MKTITKSEWKALHKDYKEIINGQRYILKGTAQGTTLVPVKITADEEANNG